MDHLLEFIRGFATRLASGTRPNKDDVESLLHCLDEVDDLLEDYSQPAAPEAAEAVATFVESLTLFKRALEYLRMGITQPPLELECSLAESRRAADEAHDLLEMTQTSAEQRLFSLDSLGFAVDQDY